MCISAEADNDVNRLGHFVTLTKTYCPSYGAGMTNYQLYEDLDLLDVGPHELADLLEVNVRTVNRWLDGTIETPTSTQRVVEAWKALKSANLPWRPNEIGISPFGIDKMMDLASRHQEHRKFIDDVCRTVEARGGSSLKWSVELDKGSAKSGDFHVSFYKLVDGNISLGTFRRSDGMTPDLVRDRYLIEDAIFSIRQAV